MVETIETGTAPDADAEAYDYYWLIGFFLGDGATVMASATAAATAMLFLSTV